MTSEAQNLLSHIFNQGPTPVYLTAEQGNELATLGYIVAVPTEVDPNNANAVRVNITEAGVTALQASTAVPPQPATSSKPSYVRGVTSAETRSTLRSIKMSWSIGGCDGVDSTLVSAACSLAFKFMTSFQTKVESCPLILSELCQSIRDAMKHGNMPLAEQHLIEALQSAPQDSQVTMLYAIYAFLDDRPYDARHILEYYGNRTTEMQQFLNLLLSITNDKAATHLMVQQDAMASSATLQTMELLAILDAEQGIKTLSEPGHHADACPTSERLHHTLQSHHTRSSSADLHNDLQESEINHLYLEATNHWNSEHQPHTTDILQLANQLAANSHLIPTLVKAQELDPQPAMIGLLRCAITHAVDHPQESVATQDALATLALLVEDYVSASHHIELGLKLQPLSSRFATLKHQLAEEAGEMIDASPELQMVVDAHPEYHDIQRKLIRTYQQQERFQQAKRQIKSWLSYAPNHPEAQEIAMEFAA